MNVITESQLNDFKKENSYNGLSKSEAFEIFSIYSTMVGDLGLTDHSEDFHLKGSEFGIDGIGILIQGQPITSTSDLDHLSEHLRVSEIEFLFFQS